MKFFFLGRRICFGVLVVVIVVYENEGLVGLNGLACSLKVRFGVALGELCSYNAQT